VNVVAPGYISTESQLAFERPAARGGGTDRAQWHGDGDRRVRALSRPTSRPSFVTGTVVVADGGHGLPETWPRP